MKQALLLLLFFPVLAYGQFQVNNDAIDLGGGNYQLTNNITYQAGSLWYKLQHNVNDPLTVEGKMYFGTNDAGADGICFVLQNNCLSAGTAGGGIGYAGMPGQSLAVEFDTYQNIAGTGNQDNHDPAYDHLAIEINGNVDHASANNLFGPVRMDSLKPNVEDGQWYDFKITYDPASTTLNIYFNNYLRKSFVYDLKNNLFSNSPYVYWGFTSSTGGFFNQQKIFINGSVSSSSLRDTTLCHGPAPVQFSLPPFTSYQGKNQAVSKKAVASSTESIAFPASNAIDGNMTTRWSSLASDPQWIYVDLITVHDIDSVVLYWETAYGKQYKI
ncbi:MAG: lectin-like domain-containing protein, partial [Cytophagaceae bacterium]